MVTSMVLLSGLCDDKMIRAVESLLLRRIHSLQTDQLTRMIKAYSLINTGSTPKSLTLVKQALQVCEVKLDEFQL